MLVWPLITALLATACFPWLTWWIYKKTEDTPTALPAVAGGLLVMIPTLDLGRYYLVFTLSLIAMNCLSIVAIQNVRKYKVEPWLKGKFGNLRHRWLNREGKVLRLAKQRAEELCALIPDAPRTQFRGFIRQVAEEFLPELFLQRDGLLDEVARIGQIIAEYKSKKLDDFSRGLLEKSIRDKQELEQALDETEQQIRDCRSFLDHIESDLLVARRQGTGLLELQARFDELAQGIDTTGQEVAKARQEIDELDDRRVVNLSTRPRQRTPQ